MPVVMVIKGTPGCYPGTGTLPSLANRSMTALVTLSLRFATHRATRPLTLCAALLSLVQTLFAAQQALTITEIKTISPEPSLIGQSYSVAFEVFAVAEAGNITPLKGAMGTATVTDGTTTCSTTLSDTGSCSLVGKTGGVRTITVSYKGGVNYDGTIVYAASGAQASHTVAAPPPPLRQSLRAGSCPWVVRHPLFSPANGCRFTGQIWPATLRPGPGTFRRHSAAPV